MTGPWTMQELVAEADARLSALPPPKNGQVRAVPDERTIRYYATIGLLARPDALRGRTALYGAHHLAQVVAIKRMQSAGKSLAEIQELWSTIDEATLARMSGVELTKARAARKDFWKRGADVHPAPRPSGASEIARPVTAPAMPAMPAMPRRRVDATPVGSTDAPMLELRIELVPGAFLTVSLSDGVSLSSADVRALRAAAAPLAAELAKRGLTAHAVGTMEEP